MDVPGKISEDIDRELLKRWSRYLPAGTPRDRAASTVRVLGNQNRHFDHLDDTSVLEHLAGERWRERLLKGLGHAFARTELHDLVAIQPASGPVHGVHYLVRQEPDEDGIVVWKPEMDSAEAKPRKIGRLFAMPEEGVWGDACSDPLAEAMFEAAFREIAVSIVKTGLILEPDYQAGAVDRLASVVRGCPVDRERQRVFERSGWYPNVIAGHPDRALARHGARFLGWPELPKDRLLLMHRTKSGAFGSFTWSPYVFQFAGRPKVSATTFELYPDGITMLVSQTIKITNPDSVGVVRLERGRGEAECR